MDTKTYKSIDNMKLCIDIFKKYMQDRYNVDIDTLDDTNVKIELYTLINEAFQKKEHLNNDVRNFNNILINRLKMLYVDKYGMMENKKAHVKSLDRENQIYGNRKNIPDQLKPEITNVKSELEMIDRRFDLIRKERGYSEDNIKISTVNFESSKDTALSESEFSDRMKLYENERNSVFKIDESRLSNPKEFYASLQPPNNEDKEFNAQVQKSYVNHMEQDIIPKPVNKLRTLYLGINGFDRNCNQYPLRYNFSVDVMKLSKTYKDIHKITFNKLIIPSEIVEQQSISNIPKTSFENSYGLTTPYVMLQIEEFQDIYDGFNDQMRKCFTQFVYYKGYHSPNGRGYIILEPCQSESKYFHPNSLSGMQRLTISLRKPSGTLLNDSRDDYKIIKLEYETYNSTLLKIVTNRFFDKNEFYKGDTVIFQDYKIPLYTSSERDPVTGQYDQQYIEYINNKVVYDKIMMFMNASEGHEIMEIGQPNDNGFYRNFYIKGPTIFDQNCGKLVVDKPMLDLIVSFNNSNTSYPDNGLVINASLQCSLSCEIDVFVGDSSRIV